MSETEQSAPTTPQRPGSYDDGAELKSAYDIPVEDLNPINPRLWSEHKWKETFERLRAEDPVHLNETDEAGRYWSLAKYEDIKAVDSDWQGFSSAHGITLLQIVHN